MRISNYTPVEMMKRRVRKDIIVFDMADHFDNLGRTGSGSLLGIFD